MGKTFFNMKFTSLAVAALFLANSSAVLLQKQAKDDCGGKWCNKGLAYDLDEGTLRKAEADDAAKTQHFNGATVADNQAIANHAAATADLAAKKAADAEAGKAKADAAAGLAAATANYTDRPAYEGARAANEAAVHAKEAALDAHLKAADKEVENQLINARKDRDLAAATAAKNAADANLKANQDRVAWEKDQLMKGQDQDALRFVNENTAAKTSEIQGKHDERERANGRLLKALAS